MSQQRQRGSVLVPLAWGLNLLALLALLLILLLYGQHSSTPLIFTSPEPGTATPFLTRKTYPTAYYLPTITPNPQATAITTEMPTPFILPNGQSAMAIGYSVARRPIEVYTFGQGERQRMIVAGIHGGYEANTIALAQQLIRYLNDHPDILPSDVTLYILPNLNPDGETREHGINGRVNEHGVDLNRNFPINWVAEWDRSGCWNYAPTTAGKAPASEPETTALVNFIMNHRIEALISYHSAALGIFPGGEPWTDRSIRLAEEIATISPYPFPPIDTGCHYTGTLADFAAWRGAAAVDLELSDHKYTDFEINLEILQILLNWQP
jgi:predicted deacylase